MTNEAVQETAPRTLDETVASLGWAYGLWKEHEAYKNEYKDEFFAHADRSIEKAGLALKLVTLVAPSHEKAIERVKRHNPTWRISESRKHPEIEGTFEIILEENPRYQPFTHEYEGVVYSRRVAKGPVMIDEEWLMEEDHELFLSACFELPWGQVVVRPIESLDAETIARLSKYIYNDKPRVTLAPPKAVKEDS